MPSLRKAIDAKCRQCSHDPCDRGTWRQQVANCRVLSCPLYPVRPMPTGSTGTAGFGQNGLILSKSEAREG